jgi:hypothetical protein
VTLRITRCIPYGLRSVLVQKDTWSTNASVSCRFQMLIHRPMPYSISVQI